MEGTLPNETSSMATEKAIKRSFPGSSELAQIANLSAQMPQSGSTSKKIKTGDLDMSWPTRRDTSKTRAAPANRDTSPFCLLAQVVVEPMGVGCVVPMWLYPSKRAASGALATRSVACQQRIDDEALCSALEELLAECFDSAVGEARADGDLRADARIAGPAHELPSFREQRSSFEALEIGLVIGFDGDREPGVGNIL